MGNSCSGDKSRTTYLDSNSDGEDSAPTKPLHAGSVRDLSFICGNEFRPDHIISCSDDNSILSSSVNSLLTGVDAAHYNFVGHRKGINKVSWYIEFIVFIFLHNLKIGMDVRVHIYCTTAIIYIALCHE